MKNENIQELFKWLCECTGANQDLVKKVVVKKEEVTLVFTDGMTCKFDNKNDEV